MRLVSFRQTLRTVGRLGRPDRLAACAVALALSAGLAAPLAAEEAPASPRPAPAAPATADPSLDALFAALAAAPDAASAAKARARIEARFLASGSPTADLLTTRAASAAEAGDRGLALDLVDAAIVVAPDWAGGHHSRALLHLSRHDIARASADVDETLRLEPRHLGAMAMKASILFTSNKRAEALVWLRRLAALDPRAPGLGERIEKLAIEVEGREL